MIGNDCLRSLTNCQAMILNKTNCHIDGGAAREISIQTATNTLGIFPDLLSTMCEAPSRLYLAQF